MRARDLIIDQLRLEIFRLRRWQYGQSSEQLAAIDQLQLALDDLGPAPKVVPAPPASVPATGTKAAAPAVPASIKAPYEQIDQLIAQGGQIMIGTILPLRNAAVAHDGTQTIVMLRSKPKEPPEAILARVNTAVAKAQATGQRVDEVNRPGAAHTYKI